MANKVINDQIQGGLYSKWFSLNVNKAQFKWKTKKSF